MDRDSLAQRSADQMAICMAREMARANKVQVGVNAPLAAAAALVAKEINARLSVHMLAMSGMYFRPDIISIFNSEWQALAAGASFPLETALDLMSGWEGVDDEPIHPLQIDGRGRVNLSGLVDSEGSLSVLGPGPAGLDVLPYLESARCTIYITKHSTRTLVSDISMITGPIEKSQGDGDSKDGFGRLVTNLSVISLVDRTPMLSSVHEWTSPSEVEASTGFELRLAPEIPTTKPVTESERAILAEVDPMNLRRLELLERSERLAVGRELWRREADRIISGEE